MEKQFCVDFLSREQSALERLLAYLGRCGCEYAHIHNVAYVKLCIELRGEMKGVVHCSEDPVSGLPNVQLTLSTTTDESQRCSRNCVWHSGLLRTRVSRYPGL